MACAIPHFPDSYPPAAGFHRPGSGICGCRERAIQNARLYTRLHKEERRSREFFRSVVDVDHYHEYLKRLMRPAGMIVSAYNGNEGFDMARRERPDLILMDLRMPILDGFESITFLKGDPETQDIPIVAVTAQAMTEDKERCFQAGADAFVTKPIDIDIFRNTLKKFPA